MQVGRPHGHGSYAVQPILRLPPHARARPLSARSGRHRHRMPARRATRPARPDSATGGIAERYILVMPEVGPEPDVAPPKVPQDIAAMRIDPENSVLVVQRGQSATLSFRAFATMKAGGDEVEITARTVFYVPDNYLVGEFPADGSSRSPTHLPTSSTDPPSAEARLPSRPRRPATTFPSPPSPRPDRDDHRLGLCCGRLSWRHARHSQRSRAAVHG